MIDTGPGISADDLQLGYHGRMVVAVDAVGLPAGAVTALVGPNGSGRLLAGATVGAVGAALSDVDSDQAPPVGGFGRAAGAGDPVVRLAGR